ncbi:MAG: hypothetical protein JWN72_1224, partial [Thermoleophilia bacterium]|nr:hypothetical protein [Thermoleophilia bacterium]
GANNLVEGGATDDLSFTLNTIPVGTVTITLTPLTTDPQITTVPNVGTLTFSALNWNVPQVVTFAAIDDFVAEASPHAGVLKMSVSAADPLYAAATIADETFQIIDNDTPGVLVTPDTSAPNPHLDVTEGGGTDVIHVVLTSQPTSNVVISPSALPGTIGSGVDTEFPNGDITFTPANWNIVQDITVRAKNDTFAEVPDPELSTIGFSTASSDPNYANRTVTTVAADVHDNDIAKFVISDMGPFLVKEGVAGKMFNIKLDTTPVADVTLVFAVTTGQAKTSITTMTFTPANWNDPQVITVSAVDDAIDEIDGLTDLINTTITSSDAAYQALTIAPFQVIVDDNDTAGILVDASIPEAASEGGTNADYKIVLTSQPTSNVVIQLTPDAQIGLVTPGTLTFTPTNWNVPKTVTVKAIDDFIAEGTHHGFLKQVAVSGDPLYDGFPLDDVDVRITDNETAGVRLSKTRLTLAEGGTTDAYSVVLNSMPAGTVTVTLTGDKQLYLGGGTSNVMTLTFTPANWSAPVTVQVEAVDDRFAEKSPHDGRIVTTVTSVTDNAYNTAGITNALEVPDVVAKIDDNDLPGIVIEESNGSTVLSEDGLTDTYRVKLSSAPTSVVTVLIQSDDQVTTQPKTLSFDSTNWDTFQTVTVSAVDDPKVEGPHSGTIRSFFTSLDPFYDGIEGTKVTATIADNDTAGVLITNDNEDLTVTEGDPGVCDYVNVTLTAQPLKDVTITVLGDKQAGPRDQRGVTFTPVNWNVTQQVWICAVNDKVLEFTSFTDLAVRSTSADPTYSGNWPPLHVRILDDDNRVLTRPYPLAKVPVWVTRQGFYGTYEIRLVAPPSADVLVFVQMPKGMKTLGMDKRRQKKVVFTKKNWSKPRLIRVGWDAKTGGRTGANIKLKITHKVRSNDPNYDKATASDIPVLVTTKRMNGGQPAVKDGKFTTAGGANSVASRGATVSAAAANDAVAAIESVRPSKPATVKASLPTTLAPSLLAKLPTERTTFSPNSVQNKTFVTNSATLADGTTALGGIIQVGRLITSSRGGFERLDRAVESARVARAAATSPTDDDRWIVLQGTDGRYYAFAAKRVTTSTTAMTTAIPAFVFGRTFVAYRDDAVKKYVAKRDTP